MTRAPRLTGAGPTRVGPAGGAARLLGAILVVVVVVVAVAACGSAPTPSPSPGPVESVPPADTGGEPTDAAALEAEVLDALGSYPYGKSAVYDAGRNQVVVTIWTGGHDLAEGEVAAITRAAEAAARGAGVIVEVSTESPPVAI